MPRQCLNSGERHLVHFQGRARKTRAVGKRQAGDPAADDGDDYGEAQSPGGVGRVCTHIARAAARSKRRPPRQGQGGDRLNDASTLPRQ
jgi:hypothetical protein